MTTSERPKGELDRAIEAACSEVDLLDGVLDADVRFYFQYIVDKIYESDHFVRRDQIEPERKSKEKCWKDIKKLILHLQKLMQVTPSFAFDEMDDYDPEFRFVYIDAVEKINRLAADMHLSETGVPSRGRPPNVHLEHAVAHLASVYCQFFGRKPSARSENPESGPFYRFCRAVFEAVGKPNLTGSLVSMIEKVCDKGYRPLDLGPGV